METVQYLIFVRNVTFCGANRLFFNHFHRQMNIHIFPHFMNDYVSCPSFKIMLSPVSSDIFQVLVEAPTKIRCV